MRGDQGVAGGGFCRGEVLVCGEQVDGAPDLTCADHRHIGACPTKVDTGFAARHAKKQRVRVCLAILSAPDRL